MNLIFLVDEMRGCLETIRAPESISMRISRESMLFFVDRISVEGGRVRFYGGISYVRSSVHKIFMIK